MVAGPSPNLLRPILGNLRAHGSSVPPLDPTWPLTMHLHVPRLCMSEVALLLVRWSGESVRSPLLAKRAYGPATRALEAQPWPAPAVLGALLPARAVSHCGVVSHLLSRNQAWSSCMYHTPGCCILCSSFCAVLAAGTR